MLCNEEVWLGELLILGLQGDIVPPTPAEEPLVMSGNLHKLGRIFKTWKQRYFEIQGCKMYYYKSSKVC